MIKKSKQINKGTVKNQTNKSDTKKKVELKIKTVKEQEVVWECLSCGRKIINKQKPASCVCSQAVFVVNNQYKVEE